MHLIKISQSHTNSFNLLQKKDMSNYTFKWHPFYELNYLREVTDLKRFGAKTISQMRNVRKKHFLVILYEIKLYQIFKYSSRDAWWMKFLNREKMKICMNMFVINTHIIKLCKSLEIHVRFCCTTIYTWVTKILFLYFFNAKPCIQVELII